MSNFDLQNESDVKEYLEKLGIEYRFGCYSEKKADVCHLLGDYLESIKKDFEKASKVYRSNCDDYGYARSCLKYGNYTFLGKGKSGTKGSPSEAFKYYERGCELKDADSCLHSGLLLVSRSMEDKVQRNVSKGIDFLQKSCEMNNATACFYLSGLHISGVNSRQEKEKVAPPLLSSTVKTIAPTDASTTTTPKQAASTSQFVDTDFILHKDMSKAFQFAYKACELKNMYACANLSQMYARGEGTDKSAEFAEKYKKIARDMEEDVKNQNSTLNFQQ